MEYTYYTCPDCGSDNVYHWGYDDGGGDYGDGIVELWKCGNCDYVGDLDYFDMNIGDDGENDNTTILST